MISSPPTSVAELREHIGGPVITPDDPTYDALRLVGAGGFEDLPSVIARPRDAGDVATVIGFAREADLEVAVRCGGHSGLGFGSTHGGVVIDLREMKGIEIDPEARIARAEAGLTAAEITAAAAEHGLAVGFGDTGSVGVGGITLGGGIGYLVRKHGMTIDSLLGVEMVTAAGERLDVDADSHPDLFWAVRGGGGNFGVVTRFTFALHPLDGVVGGILVLPATPEVVAGFMAAAAAAPEELSTIANVMGCPPMPFVPEEHHGSIVLMALVCYAGDADDANAVIAPFRALAEPIADLVRPIPYPEMFPPEEGDFRPIVVGRTMFLDHVDVATATTMLEYLEASDSSMKAVQLRALGGAMARVPADATAFAHRSAPIMGIVVSFVDGPDDRPRREEWAVGLAAAIDQGVPGAYVNFIEDASEKSLRAAYPASTWDRLREIKARYDPANLFHRNVNVPPRA